PQGETSEVENPAKLPPVDKIERIEEPYVRGSILVPTEFMSEIYKLAQDKRGEHKSLEYVGKRVHIQFDFPLSEIVVDFYDRLKSISKGYASFDYDFLEFRPSDMVKLDVLLNGDPVDALSVIVHREKSYEKGKVLTEKLRSVIPRQLYEVAIQAAIGSRVIARETVKAMGKNVTAKCYGGDISRKRKLLEKQKEGKKRMKQVGKGEGAEEASLSVLKSGAPHEPHRDAARSPRPRRGRGRSGTAEVTLPGVRGGHPHRRTPRPRHPPVRRAGLHHPLGLDDVHPARGRLHPRQQVPLRRRAALHRRAPARPAQARARGYRRLQVSERRDARLHQAHRGRGRRYGSSGGQPGRAQRPPDRRALYPSRLHPLLALHPLRLPLRLRADGGPPGGVLRHGRPPGQFPGQPLRGVRAAREGPRQGLPHLLVVEWGESLAPLVAHRRLSAVGGRLGAPCFFV